MASWTIWLHEVPLRKRAVFGFSVALGARLSSARFDRALRGVLEEPLEKLLQVPMVVFLHQDLHLPQHLEQSLPISVCWMAAILYHRPQ